jgi:hypothetical protein
VPEGVPHFEFLTMVGDSHRFGTRITQQEDFNLCRKLRDDLL